MKIFNRGLVFALAVICPSIAFSQDNGSSIPLQDQFNALFIEWENRIGDERKIEPNLMMEIKRAAGSNFMEQNLPAYSTGINMLAGGSIAVEVIMSDVASVTAWMTENNLEVLGFSDDPPVLNTLMNFDEIMSAAALDGVVMIAPKIDIAAMTITQQTDGDPSTMEPGENIAPDPSTANPFASGDIVSRGVEELAVGALRNAIPTVTQMLNGTVVENPLNGQGQTVCIISVGSPSGLAESIALGELPEDTRYVGPVNNNPRSQELIAMGEIVHDVAPGADILLTDVDINGTVAKSIDIFSGMGCTVIVDDIGEPGVPLFEPSATAQAYRKMRNLGVTVVVSAGNDGNLASQKSAVWVGDFQPSGDKIPDNGLPDADQENASNTLFDVHFFESTPSQPGEEIISGKDNAMLPREVFATGVRIREMVLRTAQQVAGRNFSTDPLEDYRLCAIENNQLVQCRSVRSNSVGVAFIDTEFNRAGVGLRILRPVGGEDVAMHLLGGSLPLAIRTSGSIVKSEQDLLVGAVDARVPNLIRGFSSDGPLRMFATLDENSQIAPVNAKKRTIADGGVIEIPTPLVLGTSIVLTSVDGFKVFDGTSAAAPHLAGIVAVLKQLVEASQGSQLSQPNDLLARTSNSQLVANCVLRSADILPDETTDAQKLRMGVGRANALAAARLCQGTIFADLLTDAAERAKNAGNGPAGNQGLNGDATGLLIDEFINLLRLIGIALEPGDIDTFNDDNNRDDLITIIVDILTNGDSAALINAARRLQVATQNAANVDDLITDGQSTATDQLAQLDDKLNEAKVTLDMLPSDAESIGSFSPVLAASLQQLQQVAVQIQQLQQLIDQVDINDLFAIVQTVSNVQAQFNQLMAHLQTATQVMGQVIDERQAQLLAQLQTQNTGDPLIADFVRAQMDNLTVLEQIQELLVDALIDILLDQVNGTDTLLSLTGPTGTDLLLSPRPLNILATTGHPVFDEPDTGIIFNNPAVIVENPDATPMRTSLPDIVFDDFPQPPARNEQQQLEFGQLFGSSIGGIPPAELFTVPFPVPSPESLFCPIKEVPSTDLEVATLFNLTPNGEVEVFADDSNTTLITAQLVGSQLLDLFSVPNLITQFTVDGQILETIPDTRFVPDENAMGLPFLRHVVLDDLVARKGPAANAEAIYVVDPEDPLVKSFELPLINSRVNNDGDNPPICFVVAAESDPVDRPASCRSLANPLLLGMEVPYTPPTDLLPLTRTPGVDNTFFTFDIIDRASLVARDQVENPLRRRQIQSQLAKSTHNKNSLVSDLMLKAVGSSEQAQAAVALGDLPEALRQAELTNVHARNACRAYTACLGNYLGLFPLPPFTDTDNDGLDDVTGQPFSRAQRCATYPDLVGDFGDGTGVNRPDLQVAPATFGNAGFNADRAVMVAAATQAMVDKALRDDLDGDGIADVADPDRDGDGIPNELDGAPDDSSGSVDSDGDGLSDNRDPDPNNSGQPTGVLEAINQTMQMAVAALAALDMPVTPEDDVDASTSDFPFNVDPAAAQTLTNGFFSSYAAFADGNGVVGYDDVSGPKLQRVSINGEPIGAPISVTTNGGGPKVAVLSNGNVAVAFTRQFSTSEVSDGFVQLFSPAGQKMGAPIAINQYTNGAQSQFQLVPLDGGFMALFRSEAGDGRPSGVRGGLYARRFNNAGQPLMDELKIDGFTELGITCLNPDCSNSVPTKFSSVGAYSVAKLANDDMVLTYRAGFGRLGDLSTPEGVFFTLISPFGFPQGQEQQINPDGDFPQVVALDNGGFAIASVRQEFGVNQAVAQVQSFDANGQAVGDRIDLQRAPGTGFGLRLEVSDFKRLSSGAVHALVNLATPIADGGGLRGYTASVNPDGSVSTAISATLLSSIGGVLGGELVPQESESALLFYSANQTVQVLPIRPEGVELDVVTPPPPPAPPPLPSDPPAPLTTAGQAAVVAAMRMMGI